MFQYTGILLAEICFASVRCLLYPAACWLGCDLRVRVNYVAGRQRVPYACITRALRVHFYARIGKSEGRRVSVEARPAAGRKPEGSSQSAASSLTPQCCPNCSGVTHFGNCDKKKEDALHGLFLARPYSSLTPPTSDSSRFVHRTEKRCNGSI